MKENNLPDSVSFKKSANNQYITIFTIEKIERIFPSLLAVRFEMAKYKKNEKNKIFGVNRLGTHTVENKIGNIRSQSHQDQGIENLIETASRYDYIKTLTKSKDDPRKKRLNSGGVRLDVGKVNLTFCDAPPECISELLLHEMGFIDDFDNEKLCFEDLIESLEVFVKSAPYEPKISYSSTKSHSIVDRYYSLPTQPDYVPVFSKKHIWTREECEIVDTCLTYGNEKLLYEILKHIPSNAITKYIERRKTELSYRPLTSCELQTFNILYKKKNKTKRYCFSFTL